MAFDHSEPLKKRVQFSPAKDFATVVFARAVAEVVDTAPEELPPLEEAIPTDALEAIIEEANDVTLTFSYQNFRITIHGDGQLLIHDPS